MQLKDTNLNYLLNQIGLTSNEADVYLYLTQFGPKFGNDIFTFLKMDKSSCYRAIKTLIDKDLVYKTGEERNQQFYANPPDHIETLIHQEEKKLKNTKKALSNFQTLIKQHLNDQLKSKKVTVITTESGRRHYMESRIKCQSKLIRDMSGRQSSAVYYNDYDEYMADYIERRVKNGVFLRQLNPFGDSDGKWERTSKELFKEVRELPENFSAQATFSVWDDVTAVSSKDKGEQIGVMIHDPLIAQMIISMFDFIWDQLGDISNA